MENSSGNKNLEFMDQDKQGKAEVMRQLNFNKGAFSDNVESGENPEVKKLDK